MQPKKRRLRRVRRLLVLLAFSAIVILLVRAYVLRVYAPGLRVEARSMPALVHAQLAEHHATYVPRSEISPFLLNAIVSIEDRRFYHHPGIDPLAIARALWVNISAQHVDQGGSTLEEQLAKRTIVHDDRTMRAKLRAMALAWAVAQDFTKQQILEMYLNDAYYGRGAYGVRAAAGVYFGTDAARLTLSQAAFLAALPRAPSIYGAHPRSTIVIGRQYTVLRDMASLGFITRVQERDAEQAPLVFAFPNP